MTRKKRKAGDDYDRDDLEFVEEAHRRDGLRRHRKNRQDWEIPLELGGEPWSPIDKKGNNRDG